MYKKFSKNDTYDSVGLRVGEKLICLDSGGFFELEYGVVYTVSGPTGSEYNVAIDGISAEPYIFRFARCKEEKKFEDLKRGDKIKNEKTGSIFTISGEPIVRIIESPGEVPTSYFKDGRYSIVQDDDPQEMTVEEACKLLEEKLGKKVTIKLS